MPHEVHGVNEKGQKKQMQNSFTRLSNLMSSTRLTINDSEKLVTMSHACMGSDRGKVETLDAKYLGNVNAT